MSLYRCSASNTCPLDLAISLTIVLVLPISTVFNFLLRHVEQIVDLYSLHMIWCRINSVVTSLNRCVVDVLKWSTKMHRIMPCSALIVIKIGHGRCCFNLFLKFLPWLAHLTPSKVVPIENILRRTCFFRWFENDLFHPVFDWRLWLRYRWRDASYICNIRVYCLQFWRVLVRSHKNH